MISRGSSGTSRVSGRKFQSKQLTPARLIHNTDELRPHNDSGFQNHTKEIQT